eukprot:TRINITY_DN13332_c0_g1_i2.p1 TRINITY_DN13332_c0_g1~~TRINITY_DN13332_c0_g1_i2.p1  ORF type:complete len:236 (-),score=34.01 TRINITY_DN13332_c0_g1_i2:37-660(-)
MDFLPPHMSRILVLLGLDAALAVTSSCDKTRPGGGLTYNYRRLTISDATPTEVAAAEFAAYAEALCCTYTHIKLVPSSEYSGQPELRTYDGNVRIYADDLTFSALAKRILDEVCGMFMGGLDCRRNDACMQEALAGLPGASTKRDSSSNSSSAQLPSGAGPEQSVEARPSAPSTEAGGSSRVGLLTAVVIIVLTGHMFSDFPETFSA